MAPAPALTRRRRKWRHELRTPKGCVVDTNVVVSGLISGAPSTPPARILDAMLDGRVIYLMSGDLLDEYSNVLRRPRLVRLHRRTDEQLDRLLSDLVANAIWRDPAAGGDAPDPRDGHLRALLSCHPQGLLVTGDRLLVENPPGGASVISPRRFADELLPSRGPNFSSPSG